MTENSKIAWTDHTWNPWQGCRKVSPGCANCYMYRDKKRYGQDPGIVTRSKRATFNHPLKWEEPAKVFVCSWSDFFIKDADPWRNEAWDIMKQTPHLTYLLLTKRPENIIDRLPNGWPLKNVWLGVTAENQDTANQRLSILLFDIPAINRFVSIEPLIGPVDIGVAHGGLTIGRYLDWVIVGGESGPNAREMDPQWAEAIMNDCNDTNTPFFMKQMSGNSKAKLETIPKHLLKREFPVNL